jgi:hypothetical protein
VAISTARIFSGEKLSLMGTRFWMAIRKGPALNSSNSPIHYYSMIKFFVLDVLLT